MGWSFQVNTRAGHVDYSREYRHVVVPTPEPMYPTGYQANADGSISTPQDRHKEKEPADKSTIQHQSNQLSSIAPMLPAGIELED